MARPSRSWLILLFLTLVGFTLPLVRKGGSLDAELVENRAAQVELSKGQAHLVQQARMASDDGTVTLVYSSSSYQQPLFNWFCALNKARGSETFARGVLIMCWDDQLAMVLKALGTDCVRVSDVEETQSEGTSLDKDTVKNLWVTRVKHIKLLLEAGLNVILTDTDAIWLQDVVPMLRGISSDVATSRALFPYDTPWGATICMGFAYFKANNQVLDLTELALKETIKSQDDQIGFNRAFFSLAVDEQATSQLSSKKNSLPMAFGRKIRSNGLNEATGKFRIHDKPISLTLFSHPTIPRYCAQVTEWSQVFVAHCHVNEGKPAPTNKNKGNQNSHTDILKKYNLFFLREDWKDVIEGYTQGTMSPPDFGHVINQLTES